MEEDEGRPGAARGTARRWPRRLAVALGAVGLAVAGLLLGAALLLPRFVDLDAVKRRAFSSISAKLPGLLEAQRVELAFRPLPRVTLRGVRFSGSRVAATADSAALSLAFWPLLRGEVRPASFRLEAPRVTVRIPAALPETEGRVTLGVVEEKVSQLVLGAKPLLSGVTVQVARGAVHLHDGVRSRFWLDGLDARVALRSDLLTVDAASTASHARRAELRLALDARRWQGEGRLRVSSFRPDDLLRYVSPGKPLPAAESSWSGEVKAEARGRGRLVASAEGASPLLRLVRGGASVGAEGLRLRATAELAGGRRRFEVRELALASPRLSAAGSLTSDAAASDASLEASASDLDLGALRSAALGLAPGVPLVRKLCDIVLEGRVTRLSASARAKSPEEMGRALTLRADFRDAEVQIPGADLMASQASGTITVSPQGLTGENLACAVGASTARGGSLRMGLRGKGAPFHLEADLDADLAQLQSLLPRWLPEGVFRRELGQVIALSGRASGRLVLGERLDALAPAVAVRSFQLAGRHPRIPYPLQLRGSFTLRGTEVSASGLTGSLGRSAVRSGALRAGFGKGPRPFQLEVDADADLAEVRDLLGRWLPRGAVRDELEQISAVSGRASGRLVLGERLDALAPALEVRSFEVAGRHRRIPLPAELRGSLRLSKDIVAVGGLTGRLGGAELSGITADVSRDKEPKLRVSEGRIAARLEDLSPWLLKVAPVRRALKDFGPPRGRVDVTSLRVAGPLKEPARWTFQVQAGVAGVSAESVLYPSPLRISAGTLAASEKEVSWSGVRASLLDSSAVVSGRLSGLRAGPRRLDLAGDGVAGPRTVQWAEQTASLGTPPIIPQAVTLEGGRLTWTDTGGTFSGKLLFAKGPIVAVDLEQTRDRFVAREIHVKDSRSDARIAVSAGKGAWDVSFAGRLRAETADALVNERLLSWDEVEGEVRAHVLPRTPRESSATGRVRLAGVQVALKGKPPLVVESAALEGRGKTLRIESARVATGPLHLSVQGQVEARADVYAPRLKVSATEIDLGAAEAAFGAGGRADSVGSRGAGGAAVADVEHLPIRGSVEVEVGTLRYGRLAWKPVRATLTLFDGVLAGDFEEMGLCGVDSTGRVAIERSDVEATLKASARDQRLEEFLPCLLELERVATGRLRGSVNASLHGKPGQLLRSAQGDASFVAKDGRIYRFDLLAKIFGVLSVTEVLRGRLPDFQEGIAYRKVEGQGLIRDGVLTFDKGHLDGKSVQVFWQGTIDLATAQADLTVLVSPFRTADAIISHIPLVNYVMADRLVAVPVRVRGDLKNPSITPLAPSSIGSELVGMVGRVLKLPYHLIQPLIPGSKPQEANPAP